MSVQPDPILAENLRRWEASGQPRQWVESHCGHWEHGDWLVLLGNLRHSEFWPLDPDAVGAVVERLKRERCNLRRWEASGQPRRWVEAHRGEWGHDDWLSLLQSLQASEFWPVPLDAVGQVLEGLKAEWHNLRCWQESGQPCRWIEARRGAWGHEDWLSLVRTLQQSEFWPLDLDAVGRLLEALKGQYLNLHCWEESGWPRRWVEARQGEWNHHDWLSLVDALRASSFWPLALDAVGQVLEGLKDEWRVVCRWKEPVRRRAGAGRGRAPRRHGTAMPEDVRGLDAWSSPPTERGNLRAA